jgi:hypothetical protein
VLWRGRSHRLQEGLVVVVVERECKPGLLWLAVGIRDRGLAVRSNIPGPPARQHTSGNCQLCLPGLQKEWAGVGTGNQECVQWMEGQLYMREHCAYDSSALSLVSATREVYHAYVRHLPPGRRR